MIDYVKTADRNAERLRQAGIGSPVVSTQRARDNGVLKTREAGRIVGWGRHKWTVRVVRAGRKTPSTYHVDFWEPV